jgi:ABC-type oligopeptide transport system substrate-binding subunit
VLLAFWPSPARATTIYGPRVEEALCKIYPNDVAEWDALKAAQIELVDCPKPPSIVIPSPWPADYNYTLDAYRDLTMYEFDINNNETMPSYPNVKSPTSDRNFRHAIAHMVDKDFTITNILGGSGAELESPIMPWLRWYDPNITTHPYNPATVCQILYDNGWRDSPDPNVATSVHFPSNWLAVNGGPNVTGQTLAAVLVHGPHGGSDPGLIFYGRGDKADRHAASNLLIYGDTTHKGLESIGVPCDEISIIPSYSSSVMYQKNFHIYAGGWSLGRDPDYLYDIWGSQAMDWNTRNFAFNYDNVQNATWDTAIAKVKFADNLDQAEVACHQALQIFSEQVFFIPLWAPVGYLGHSKSWHALNVDSYGVKDPWNLYCMNNPSIGITGGQIRWGFSSTVESLNVIYSTGHWDWQILNQIYDTLLVFNPMNIGVDMPWMASNWNIGTWTNPNTGLTATKISFTIKTGIRWTNPITGTDAGPVTPEDVRYTFQFVYDHNGWNKNLVADLFKNPDGSLKIEISGNTITFYEQQKSPWALHWIGGMPIIPKSVFEAFPLENGGTGFYPGGSDPSTLVGSGPFYFSNYNEGVDCLLKANRLFHMSIVPNTDTTPTTIKLDWGIFKSNVKSGDWQVNVLDLIIVATAIGWTGRPDDIPQDINKDGKVNVLDFILVSSSMGADWN